LTQKIEYWSIEDIVSVVNGCLLLHNWMVTVRLSRDEAETNDWYDVTGDGIEQTGDSGEQTGDSGENGDVGTPGDGGINGNDGNASNRRNVTNVATITRDDNVSTTGNFIVDVTDPRHAIYQQACLQTREQCVNDRWMHLYDAENFFRLQNAIFNELIKINWNFEKK
jgi:hypothetical protein